MKKKLEQWKHVFKLDPAKPIDDESLHLIATSGTDALIIGGTTDITKENTYQLLTKIQRYELPYVLEVSDDQAVVFGFDRYFIPFVLNAGDTQWMIRKQQQALKQFQFPLPWELFTAEGYVVLNEHCAAAELTQADTNLLLEDVCAYAKLAEHFFRFPIFYMEYSGIFGNMDWVRTVRRELNQTRLFYGGGIDSFDKAKQAAQAADTIVVGNIIYENLELALETVGAVQSI